jgi:hypothetical protein
MRGAGELRVGSGANRVESGTRAFVVGDGRSAAVLFVRCHASMLSRNASRSVNCAEPSGAVGAI